MNNRADQESLLAEVLAEASPPDFRAAMLAETLRRARRRRQFRQAAAPPPEFWPWWVCWRFWRRNNFPSRRSFHRRSQKKSRRQSYELVRTQPLPASALVSTRSFSAAGFAASVPKVVEVATVSGGFRLINDDELLALLADKPAVLIRTGPQSEELVFANPEDQKGFPLN